MSKTNRVNKSFTIFLIGCVVFLLVSPFFIFSLVNNNLFFNVNAAEGKFLELWNVDTFEGGTNSRTKFLENAAISFEKQNRKNYIIVRNVGVEQLENMLKEGVKPDLISFGIGVGETIRSVCVSINTNSKIKQNLLNCGVYKNNQLSIPWCYGGYVYCGNVTKENAIYGVGIGNTIPPTISGNKIVYKDQYEAYKAFVNGKFDVLLGTQRDFVRLQNKLNLGVIENCNFEYVSNYSDLVQHIAICCGGENLQVAQNFVNYLLSNVVQKKIKNIGMFSVNNLIYTNTSFQEFELAMQNVSNFGNVFVDDLERLNNQQK